MISSSLQSIYAVSFYIWARRIACLSIAVYFTGCASTAGVKQIDRLESIAENPKILIITPDVKYYLLTAGGVPQPQAEWTEAARKNFSTSLKAFADENNIDIVTSEEGDQLTDAEISYQKLYSAVGSSILTHHFGTYKLPAKQGAFDWTLGPGVALVGEKYDADYALFSYYRDYQASGGRTAFAIFAAMVGVGIATGGEVGFASLVDLRTGDIVWFNRVSTGVGELREKQGARATIDLLFKNLPVG